MATPNIVIEGLLPKRESLPDMVLKRLDAKLEATLRDPIKPKIKREFEKRTTGWRTPIYFAAVYSNPGGDHSLYVYPRAGGGNPTGRELWAWLSKGTKPHPISPRRAPKLFIHGGIRGYNPRTSPGNRYGGPGTYNEAASYYTGRTVMQHIPAREFEKYIREENQDWIFQTVQAAVRSVLR